MKILITVKKALAENFHKKNNNILRHNILTTGTKKRNNLSILMNPVICKNTIILNNHQFISLDEPEIAPFFFSAWKKRGCVFFYSRDRGSEQQQSETHGTDWPTRKVDADAICRQKM